MPSLVRLPAEPAEDEVRVWWENSPSEGNGLFVHGPRSLRRRVMAAIADRRKDVPAKGDFGAQLAARASGLLVDVPSLVEDLEAEGYDPQTLVFTISRKGSAIPSAEVPRDARAALEEANDALARTWALVDGIQDWKGVYVLDEAEMEKLRDLLGKASASVSEGLGASGT